MLISKDEKNIIRTQLRELQERVELLEKKNASLEKLLNLEQIQNRLVGINPYFLGSRPFMGYESHLIDKLESLLSRFKAKQEGMPGIGPIRFETLDALLEKLELEWVEESKCPGHFRKKTKPKKK